MENPATTGDLQDRWHPNPLSDAEAEMVAATRLDEAWRALQIESPYVVSRIESGAVSVDVVVDVLCSAALRILRNPEGFSQASMNIDDYKEAWDIDPATTSINLYFTRAELARLSPLSSGAWTIRPGV